MCGSPASGSSPMALLTRLDGRNSRRAPTSGRIDSNEHQRRPVGARQVQRARAPLVGSDQRIQTAARHQSVAAELHRPPMRRACRDKRCSTSAAAAAFSPKPMAHDGAKVTGIDLSDKALGVARLHQLEIGRERRLPPDRRLKRLAIEAPATFDVVTCMELLEHVPDPASTIDACAKLVRAGGHVVFSTINRNAKAYALAIVGAEYVLGLLPRGTHDYARFLKPVRNRARSRARRGSRPTQSSA